MKRAETLLLPENPQPVVSDAHPVHAQDSQAAQPGNGLQPGISYPRAENPEFG